MKSHPCHKLLSQQTGTRKAMLCSLLDASTMTTFAATKYFIHHSRTGREQKAWLPSPECEIKNNLMLRKWPAPNNFTKQIACPNNNSRDGKANSKGTHTTRFPLLTSKPMLPLCYCKRFECQVYLSQMITTA